ncbi:FixH family protein [Lysinibacillus sp. SGAir0095]|uniref:FixH family protein n=1 Tax=Lysinibacillus sp. SGAir0095 TaxID=2070463 RepID=UPI0010CD4CBD|nr:FixH family protein [Lysinibacillus sp. SGAir0095]QCR34122.1 hypothetical protein C1N55_19215 [Lysinibacillus sp. SGAir0095]
MKRMKYIFFVSVSCILLSACSLKEDVAELYKKESPMEAEIIIPDTFVNNEKEIIKAVLTQNGEKVEGADYVHFEIWKQDGTLHYYMEPAKEMGNGIYALSKDFDSNGLYYIKVHASKNGSIIMPQKQFVVGDLSKEELEYLQKDIPTNEGVHEHHH